MPERSTRAGFALLLGRPNVGKSTLLNRLVGEHLAIVSPRPQTTRTRILGVVNGAELQLCLLDSPGVHKAKGLLNQTMVRAAVTAIQEVDVVLYLAEAGWPAGSEPGQSAVDIVGPVHRELLAEIARTRKPAILVLTKIDLLPKELLLPITEAWSKAHPFQEIYPLSGLTGENVDRFVEVIRKYLPEGPPLFDEETVTDQPERVLAAELIREQLFLQLREEIPYGVAVAVDTFDESSRESADTSASSGLVRIEASIIVERESHKGIVIGARGAQLKKIGSAARSRIERMLGARVWLGLHVRVVPGWTEKKGFLADFGYLTR